jgi:osmotically-inducible protein OsmY
MRHHAVNAFRFVSLRSGAASKAGDTGGSDGSHSVASAKGSADDALAALIANRLAAADDGEIDRVHVAVQRACVTLRGEVSSRRSMGRIEALIASCEGVSRIDNQMRVGYSH